MHLFNSPDFNLECQAPGHQNLGKSSFTISLPLKSDQLTVFLKKFNQWRRQGEGSTALLHLKHLKEIVTIAIGKD
jgi:hypothetical protein